LNLESGGQGGLLQLVNGAQHAGAAQYLGQQTSGGTLVDVIRITEPFHVYASPGADAGRIPNRVIFTLYINAQTYLIDHVNAEALTSGGEALATATLEIGRHDIVPLASAPASAFSFSSPPGACVVTVDPSDPSQSSQFGTCSGFTRP